MSIEVEKGVPTPVGRTGYPFASMEVGDSFRVEAESDDDKRKAATSIGASARNFCKKHKAKFTTRRTEDGVRCWRTE